jgi:hypothetical protein
MGAPPQTAPQQSIGGGGWPAGGQPQYEFSEQENKTVERAAAWAKGLGLIMFIECGLQLINLNVLGLLLHATLGYFFWRGGQALTEVVETEGNDVQHLLEALEKLGTALQIRIIVVSVVAVVLFIGGLLGVFLFLGSGS